MIGSGKSPTSLEAMSLNYLNIVDLDVIHAVDSEVERGLKSNCYEPGVTRKK